MLNDLLHRLRSLVHRKTVEGELDDELRFHFEKHVEKSVVAGLSREEAVRRTRMELGGFDQLKEECRDARGVQLMENFIQDVRYALRTLVKSPGFTAVALLTLALGIGANTAIFSVVYGVMLAPLPYRDSARLMVLNETTPKVGSVSVSYPNFLDWRAQSHSFSQMAVVAQTAWNMSGGSQPETVNGEAVSPNYLSMLGVQPMLGRDFDASEEKAGTNRVALLHYPMWQSHFGADPSVLGKTIALDGQSFTIIGVLPAGFRSLDKIDVMVPIGVWATGNDAATERGDRGDMVGVGRLKPGISEQQSRTELEGIAQRLAIAYPMQNDKGGAEVTPIRETFSGNIAPALLVLGGAVMFVLLIACANVANLLLMRGAARTHEIALRIALGAGRGRIISQMLTESFVLAALGGGLGIMLAFEMIRGLVQLVPMSLLAGATIALNGAVLLFAAGVVVLSALVFGLMPAARLAKPDVQSSLKENSRSSSASARQMNLRDILAIGEVAVALILLVAAGLMMKSFYRLLSVNPGFRPERVLTMELGLRTAQYEKGPAILNFWHQTLERVRTIPGVESVAVATVVPMASEHSRSDITIEEMDRPSPGNYPHPDVHVVSEDYLRTLGVSLQRGRNLLDSDNETAPAVGMINQKVAQKYFPTADPIGKRFAFGHVAAASNPPKWITIVGVVGDTSLYGLQNPARLEIYLPYQQDASNHMNLVVKSGMDPAALTSAIRGAIAAIDKDQPIFAISTMTALINASVATDRLTLVLLGLFGMLALVLASIGIYGVISYSVTQRTHEIGVRIALGAARWDVLRMVLGHGVKIAGIGVAIGLAASFGLMRLMVKLLYSVNAADPLTFAGVGMSLLLVAMLACYVPARRTLRVDPMKALRYE
jgi:putative ABC transport system permease protein